MIGNMFLLGLFQNFSADDAGWVGIGTVGGGILAFVTKYLYTWISSKWTKDPNSISTVVVPVIENILALFPGISDTTREAAIALITTLLPMTINNLADGDFTKEEIAEEMKKALEILIPYWKGDQPPPVTEKK